MIMKRKHLLIMFLCLGTLALNAKEKKKQLKAKEDPVLPCQRSATVNWSASYYCLYTNTILMQNSYSICTTSSTAGCETAQSQANTCALQLADASKQAAVNNLISQCNKSIE